MVFSYWKVSNCKIFNKILSQSFFIESFQYLDSIVICRSDFNGL